MSQAINGITDEDVELFERTQTLNGYQRIATKSAIYPGQGSPLGLMYTALKGCGEAGEFAEHVGKAMRDEGFAQSEEHSWSDPTLSPYRRNLLIKEIGDELWYLSAKCNELGISLFEAALENLKKLKDRSERDKLQGSGDER
jgi:NTP pyrophosphatase (non-canonical NTP hydrolase)